VGSVPLIPLHPRVGVVPVGVSGFAKRIILEAGRFAEAVRGHWGTENSLHWSLDVSFREDESRIRKGATPDNFAVIRHICMNMLKQETTLKRGIKAKRYRSAMDSHYRERVLFELS
jgi:hypothetical protein